MINLEREQSERAEADNSPSMFLTSGGAGTPPGSPPGSPGSSKAAPSGLASAAEPAATSVGAGGTGRLNTGSAIWKYDMYTVDEHTGRVYGLTDGLAASDKGSATAQVRRQAKFPSHVMRAALNARVQDGDATVMSDRRHILNSIIGLRGDDLEMPSLDEHHEYHVANRLMVQRVVHLTLDVALSQGQAERQKLLMALTRSHLEEFTHGFLHGDAPVRGFTEPVLCELLEALPDTLCKLDIVLPFAFLPTSLSGYGQFIHLLCLNLSDSIFLEALPDWIAEMRSLKHVFLQRCIRLRTLPRKLSEIFSAYKDIIVDLTGCSQIFFLEDGVDLKAKAREDGTTPFLSIGALDVVRDFLTKADEAKNDSVRIKDGYGRDISLSMLRTARIDTGGSK